MLSTQNTCHLTKFSVGRLDDFGMSCKPGTWQNDTIRGYKPPHQISGVHNWGSFSRLNRCIILPLSGPGTVVMAVNEVSEESIVDKTSEKMIILYGCHFFLILKASYWYSLYFSVLVTCRLWVSGIPVSMNAAFWFVISTSIMLGRMEWTDLATNRLRSQHSLQLFSRTTSDSYL